MPERKTSERTSPARASSRRASESDAVSETSKGGGWAEVTRRQQAMAEEKEDRSSRPFDFFLKAGESAVIQVLNDEPYTFDAHGIKSGTKFLTLTCQLVTQKTCLMCREKIKQTWKAAFLILDYRGKWDKEKKKFMGGDPVEKLWIVNMTQLGSLQAIRDKRKKDLTQLVLEISRTGSGKNDTSYNFEQAIDENDERMLPKRHKITSEPLNKLCAPLSDAALDKLGFEAAYD